MGMVCDFLPFMVLPLYASVEKIDWSIAEAAADLGADRVRVFWHALLPQILPGVTAGVILVLLPATGQFVIPDLLGGAKTSMLGNLIQQQFASSRDWPFGSAISVVALVLVSAGLWIYLRRRREEDTVI
jgi:spermidine/putrescine transport system permease protein